MLVLAGAILGLAGPAGARKVIQDDTTQCLAEFRGIPGVENGGTVECDDCDPSCDKDGAGVPNNSCTFDLQICVNQAGGQCAPADLKRFKVRKSGKCNLHSITPAPSGTDPVCGPVVGMKVDIARKRKPSKCIITVEARSQDKPPRVDVNKLVLVCNPQQGSTCPLPPTTTTLATSTTTTSTTTNTTTTELPTTTTSTTTATTATTTSTTETTTSTTGTTSSTTTTTETTTSTTETTSSTTTSTTMRGAVCGNGEVEPGEQCDPPGSATCPSGSPGGALLDCLEGCVCPPVPTTTSTTATTETTTSTTSSTTETTTTTTTTSTSTSSTTETTTTTTTTSTTATTTTVTTTTTSSTTSTTLGCCGNLPALLSFTTASGGCGTNPPGSVSPGRCVQGTNNGTACTADSTCTGGGVCRGHLDCSGLYFGGGQPAGINLPGVVPDNGLNYNLVTSCDGDTMSLEPTTAADVPGPGCTTPAGTPTYGQRHCTSAGCLFGAPLALPNPLSTATGTCVVNVVADRVGAGTGTASCSTGAIPNPGLNLPLDSQIYLTGSLDAVQVCSRCVGGTLGVCGSGMCAGGPRNGMACTPETSALNGSYPTSHDCPPPNAPSGQLGTCGVAAPGSTFLGCLPIGFHLSTETQTLTSFATGAQARVFCGFCFDPDVNLAFANPPAPCTSDAECAARGDNFTSCQQQSNGAFRNPFATMITETGTASGTNLGDGLPHAATLVSVFCVPPSYDPIVDPSGELPGAGAVSLPGVSELIQ